ncbi:transcription elongation factor GreA [Helicobacter sp. 11S02629-2]|uniref:transcription elongation factor GreA n=1 Tax=Helicobacter sp. 11S02629-2 TaxID=1476195 RepID=UPI000BA4ED75|nr:transcription elongation factor GreA [Helicobacter sp. 11S02629-2]PAF45570.1 transcription elongation factor GreA [Helicobacter sp. 11S02629-2]
MAQVPMSKYGYDKLVRELTQLKEVERPNIVTEISIAREHGDLKENAEYHAAKEKQAVIESRINSLSVMLANAVVLDPSTLSHESVSYGSTVVIEDIDTEEELTYTIVGVLESNPRSGLISYDSPIAKDLLGKEVGDQVSITLPRGECDYEIKSICYKPIDFK